MGITFWLFLGTVEIKVNSPTSGMVAKAKHTI